MIRNGVRRALTLALRRRDRWEREVEEEIKLHLALRAEQLAAEGRSSDEAYREAVRRFGSLGESRARLLEAARHREEKMQRTEFLTDLRQDLSFALRGLSRQKGWTAITILTLALGIGATTAVFSVVSTLLLHPLPYPNADRVVTLYQQPITGNNTGMSVSIVASPAVVRDWRANARTFEDIQPGRFNVRTLKTASGDPSSLMTTSVLPTFPAFAGQQPILGRMFTANDLESGAKVIVLGEGFWRERLAANRAVLGRILTVGDTAYTIIGVAPATMRFGTPGRRPTDVWLPLDLKSKAVSGNLMGRLRPGVTTDAARRELDSIYARTAGGKPQFSAVVKTPGERLSFRDSLLLLAAAVGLVLLVACANVAHLLIARTSSRRRELSIRTALGAGRGRIFRQLLTESSILCAAGAAAGLFVGWLGLKLLIAVRPSSLDELKAAHLDSFTLWLTIGVSVTSGLLFGVVGAIQTSRESTNEALKGGSLATTGSASRNRVRRLLVISEMALSAVLIVGAALAMRSLQRLEGADVGFVTRGLYTLYPTWGPQLQEPAARHEFLRALDARLRTATGVRDIALVQAPPGSRSFSIGRLEIDGEATSASSDATSFIDVNAVQPHFFRLMDIRLVEGGTFSDTSATSNQVIVNASFARKHWPAGAALGHRIRVSRIGSEPWLTIVGVARDTRPSGPAAESTAPMLYLPPSQESEAMVVRSSGDARSLAPLVKVARDMGARALTIESVDELMTGFIAEPKFVMLLLSVFSAFGLALATIGLYGVMAFSVSQETREIGIRVALGASRQNLIRRVVVRGVGLALAGAVLGLGAATWATKIIATQLYGIERLDPVSFAVGGVLLILAAGVACIVPTRRAVAVDPMTAIRAD